MKDNNQLKEKAEELRNHLSEQFHQLQPKEPAPQELKKNVFDTLDTLQLMADVADLFTVKFAKANTRMVGFLDDTAEQKIEDDTSNETPVPPAQM